MFSLSLIALLAANGFASPVPDTGHVAEPRQAPPPGYPMTNVTFGDVTNLWGCGTDPEATFKAQLPSMCPDSGSCISNQPYTASVQYVSPDDLVPNTETLTITPQGAYPAGLAGPIIQAIETATTANGVLVWNTLSYGTQSGPINHASGGELKPHTCQVATFPAFIGVEYCTTPDQCGNIQLSIVVTKPANGFCAGVGQASSLMSSVGAAFGPAGGPMSATFGTISAACQIHPN